MKNIDIKIRKREARKNFSLHSFPNADQMSRNFLKARLAQPKTQINLKQKFIKPSNLPGKF